MSCRLDESVRWRRSGSVPRFALLMGLVLCAGVAAADSDGGEVSCQRLSGALPAGTHWLEVHQLGAPLGRIVPMSLASDGRWSMQARELANLRVSSAVGADPDQWLYLDDIPALDYRLDACRLILTLDLREVSRPHQQLRYRRTQNRGAVDPVTRSISLQISPRSEFDQRWRHSGNLRLRGAGPFGRWLSEWLHDGERLHRLDTRWVREWPNSHLQLTVRPARSRTCTCSSPAPDTAGTSLMLKAPPSTAVAGCRAPFTYKSAIDGTAALPRMLGSG